MTPIEIFPPLRAHEELLERGERFRIRCVDFEDVRVPGGRVVDHAELLVDRGDLHPVVARELRVRNVFGDFLVELDEPLLRLRHFRDFFELESRVVEARVFLERRGERVERARVIRERFGRDARDLAAERDALLHVVFARREDVERGDELVPLAAFFVDRFEDRRRVRFELGVREHRLEGGLRAFVLRVEEEDLAIVLERARRVVQMLLERRAEAELEIDERPLVVVELDAPPQDVDVGLPSLEASVENVERAERGDVGGLFFEHGDVRLDRLVHVLHFVFEELGDLEVDVLLVDGIGREIALLLVDAEEVRERLRLAIQVLERGERFGVLAVRFVDGAVRRERLIDLVHLGHEHATELQSQHDREIARAVVVRRLDRRVVRRDRTIPALRCLRRALRVGRGLLVVRRNFERGEITIERLLRLLHASFVERRDFAQENELVVGVLLVRELHLDRVREELRVAGRGVDRNE